VAKIHDSWIIIIIIIIIIITIIVVVGDGGVNVIFLKADNISLSS
jgi:hypothetical protein